MAALRVWMRSAEGKGARTIRELQGNEDCESLRWHDAITARSRHLPDSLPDAWRLKFDEVQDGGL